MARTSSPNRLSCRNPYQNPHSLNASPLFTENPFFFFTEMCFFTSPPQKPAPMSYVWEVYFKQLGGKCNYSRHFSTESLGTRWPFTGVSQALRARNPKKSEKCLPGGPRDPPRVWKKSRKSLPGPFRDFFQTLGGPWNLRPR